VSNYYASRNVYFAKKNIECKTSGFKLDYAKEHMLFFSKESDLKSL
jgi:hypothetical protein